MGDNGQWKRRAKKVWHFIWHDDSALAFVVNILLAYLIIKFLLYPGIGLMLGTSYPIVAVVSGSMDHVPTGNGSVYALCGKTHMQQPQINAFSDWWQYCGNWYEERGIDEQTFATFALKNGFRRGDLVVLVGAKQPKIGDVIVFPAPARADPIIHRVIQIDGQGPQERYTTKGDNNPQVFPSVDENIAKTNVLGRGVLRVPYLGYVKIFAFELFQFITGGT